MRQRAFLNTLLFVLNTTLSIERTFTKVHAHGIHGVSFISFELAPS
jgi:hypothetical protein